MIRFLKKKLSFNNYKKSFSYVYNFVDCSLDVGEENNSKLLMPHPSESITERLLSERKKALELIVKDALSKKPLNIGLPCHLLKPSERNSTVSLSGFNTESTVNISDLENMEKTGKVS